MGLRHWLRKRLDHTGDDGYACVDQGAKLGTAR